MADRKPNAASLSFPQAVVFPRTDAYNSTAQFQTLKDNETGTAVNCEFGLEGTIRKSNGYYRLDSTKLSYASATGTGAPINGFFEYTKLGSTATYSASTSYIVGAGESLWNWTPNTATVAFSQSGASNSVRLYSACSILSGSTASVNYWQFAQIQDPVCATNDIVVMTNGIDPLLFWTGSGTAAFMSGIANQSLNNICASRFLLSHKRRLFFAGVRDSTDIDAEARVDVTGFSSSGQVTPHRVSATFYLGGSDGSGPITGATILRDQLVFFKRHSIWKMSLGAGAIIDVEQVKTHDDIGCIAPNTVKSVGNACIFLSDKGIYMFDGINLRLISEPIRRDLETNTNIAQWPNAYAIYYKTKNQYRISLASAGQTFKDLTYIFDMNITTQSSLGNWFPPQTFYRSNIFADYRDSNLRQTFIFGDYRGFIYEADRGDAAGISSGRNSTATSGAANTLTDTGATFTTTNQGLEGMFVEIRAGTGIGQRRLITSNTGTVLTVESNWSTVPNTTSQYSVAGIPFRLRTKDFDFGLADITKLFRMVNIRTRQTGGYNLEVCYFVDFNFLEMGTCREISLSQDQLIWNRSDWGDIFRGLTRVNIQTVNLRNTVNQSLNGSYFALRFSNLNANEPVEIYQYDVSLKPIGRRVR